LFCNLFSSVASSQLSTPQELRMSNAHKVVVLARMAMRTCVLPALLVMMVALAGCAQTVSQTLQGRVYDLRIVEHDWYKDFPPFARDNDFKPEYESFDSERAKGCRACPEGYGPCDHAETDYPCARRCLNHSSYSDRTEPQGFVYRVTLRNAGNRLVKTVIWDYVFRDPTTDAELARHTFATDIRLAPRKTRLLIARSFAPPTRVISVKMLYQWSAGSTYAERIEIKRVVFADGSVISY
jgi:hypothetical protein